MLKNLKSVRITGIFIAALLAILSWIITRDAISSFIIGLLAEALVLLVELKHDLWLEMKKLTEAAKLDQMVSIHVHGITLQQILEDYSLTIDTGIPLFIDRADEVLIEFSNQMYNLSSGRLEVTADLVQIKGAWILRNLRKSGFATALIRLDSFWFPESGQFYQREIIDAANRGLQMTRIFLIDDPENGLNENFKQIIEEQVEAGVEVRFCITTELSNDLVFDLGIWDEEIVAYVNTAQYSNTIVGATFFNLEAEKIKACRIRDRLLHLSKSYTEIETILEATRSSRHE